VKRMDNDAARSLRVRTVVAYPAVTIALVVSVVLALTPVGNSQVMALASSSTPTASPTASTTTTASPSSTSTTSTTGTTPATTPSATASITPSPAPIPSVAPSPSPNAGPNANPSGSVIATVAPPGDHHVLAWIGGPELQATYFPIDAPVVNASPFQTFRVRFRMHNAGTDPVKATPRLEYRPDGAGSYVVVPDQPILGIPFHVAREWVPSLGLGGGTIQSPLGEDIAVADFRIGKEGGFAVLGHRSMGANPDRPTTLPSVSYTEEEFTVTLSKDAPYSTGYQLRITDGGTPLTGTDVATIHLGAPPAVRLSPGQRQGVAVVGPKKTSASRIAYPLVSGELRSAPSVVRVTAVSAVSAVSAVYIPSTLSYPLTANTLAAATATSDIHGPYSITTDQCSVCHRGHTAQAPSLLVKGSQSTLCFMCHDGTAANTNVRDQYYPLVALPANDSATREYYSHDALAASTHTNSGQDEFGGVSNRHSQCADCHNSHKAKTTDGAQALDGTGWEASGRQAGVSGVSVVNGAADTAPTYTFLDGVTKPVTLEYQLCFKCHSGFTKLLSPITGKPSKDALDKAVEFNPANASYHPVEAAGTNKTAKMDLNLAATSPYKLWDFNSASTIRCLNCHASGTTPQAPASPPLPLPGMALPPHTSSNRGILLRNYQDRVLKSAADTLATKAAYSAGDFALCYVCHGEEPFANATGEAASTATNFSLHGQHLNLLAGKGAAGTDIDKPGDGQGNAICAECHFRIHSATNKVGSQVVPGTRLVNFAPNVLPEAGTLSWTPGATSGGSCTLTCHDHEHTNAGY